MQKRIIFIIGLVIFCLGFYINNAFGYQNNNTNNPFKNIENMSDAEFAQWEKNLNQAINELDKICREQQPQNIERVKKMEGCKSGALIPTGGFSASYKVLGIKDNSCSIEKRDYKTHSTSTCSVPMSEYNKAYNYYMKFVTTLCDDNSNPNIQKQGDAIIMNYCR